ncbi:hypothetical protein E2320_012768 [Naja naja]|nr:hypothetical protein E2320_012768 [Naja naja]
MSFPPAARLLRLAPDTWWTHLPAPFCFPAAGSKLAPGELKLALAPLQVFFSAYIFNSNVMVKVATQPADNPLDVLSRKLHLGPSVGRDVPRLSLPGKLVFPSSTGSHFSMLGIGDIVMPGLLLCFVLRYDNYKKQANGDSCGTAGPGNISGRMQKVSYFHCTLIGYFL